MKNSKEGQSQIASTRRGAGPPSAYSIAGHTGTGMASPRARATGRPGAGRGPGDRPSPEPTAPRATAAPAVFWPFPPGNRPLPRGRPARGSTPIRPHPPPPPAGGHAF